MDFDRGSALSLVRNGLLLVSLYSPLTSNLIRGFVNRIIIVVLILNGVLNQVKVGPDYMQNTFMSRSNTPFTHGVTKSNSFTTPITYA